MRLSHDKVESALSGRTVSARALQTIGTGYPLYLLGKMLYLALKHLVKCD